MKGHELDVKTQECEEYEKSVVENQSMLQHSSARITELEDMQGELQRQVPAFILCIFTVFPGSRLRVSDSENAVK